MTAAGEVAHSCCFGFGLDRITLALLRTHGLSPGDWPAAVRDRLGHSPVGDCCWFSQPVYGAPRVERIRRRQGSEHHWRFAQELRRLCRKEKCDVASMSSGAVRVPALSSAGWPGVICGPSGSGTSGSTRLSGLRRRRSTIGSATRGDLRYFDDELAGPEEMYRKLELLPWYYLDHKPEFDIAVRHLDGAKRVLEIGSEARASDGCSGDGTPT